MYITRKGNIDCSHRILGHSGQCRYFHGHTYLYELTFEFDDRNVNEKLGYAIDFGDIKKIGVEWLLKYMDHGFIANPKDIEIIDFLKKQDSKLYILSLNGEKYCNSSVENITKEVYIAMKLLFKNTKVNIFKVILYETPNSFAECLYVSPQEITNFINFHSTIV